VSQELHKRFTFHNRLWISWSAT